VGTWNVQAARRRLTCGAAIISSHFQPHFSTVTSM
jgi:hypothetical protein